MDHEWIETGNYVDRYLRGDLPQQDADEFEQHFLACQSCLDELANIQRMRDGLEGLVESGELTLPSAVKTSVSWWQTRTWAMAATVLLAVSLTATGVMYDSLGRQSPANDGTAEVFMLSAFRSSASAPPGNVIQADASTGTLVLMIDAGPDVDDGSYSATLTSQTVSMEPLTFEPLRPGYDAMIAVALSANRLQPGDYSIEVRKLGENAVRNQARFRLERNR